MMERHHCFAAMSNLLEKIWALGVLGCLGFRRNQGMIGQGGDLNDLTNLKPLGCSQASTSIVNSSTKPKLLRKDQQKSIHARAVLD